jgi:hypothetical protein
MKSYLSIFLSSIIFFSSCTSKLENESKSESLNFNFQNRMCKIKFTAFNNENQIGLTELIIKSSFIYDKVTKDSTEIPSQIVIQNISNSGLLLCSSVDIETQKLKSGVMDCAGKIQIFIGGYESTILESPFTTAITEKDKESFIKSSIYNLKIYPVVKHQSQFRTITFELTTKYNYNQKNIDTISIKLLGENLNFMNQNKASVGIYNLSLERKNVKVGMKIEHIN